MGAAPRSIALKTDANTRFFERACEAADRNRSSPLWLVGMTAIVAALWFMPVERAQVGLRILLAVWWGSWATWVVSRHAKRVEVFVEVIAAIASVAAIFAAGSLSTPVWLLAFVRSFAWLPRRKLVARAGRYATIAAHLALAVSCIAEGQPAAALIVVAMLAGQIVVQLVSSQLLQQRLELEAEGEELHRELERIHVQRDRERIAREIHDGLGAELVALNISLRSKGPTLTGLQERVVALLEELRSVTWSLRGGSGSLAEFEKVVGAQLRTALPAAKVLTATNVAHRSSIVDPEAALATLATLQAAASQAAKLDRVTEVQVELSAPPLTMTVRMQGAPREAMTAWLAHTQDIDVGVGVLPEVSMLEQGTGLRISVGTV